MWDNYCNLCRLGMQSGNDSIMPFFACVFIGALFFLYIGVMTYVTFELHKLAREHKERLAREYEEAKKNDRV